MIRRQWVILNNQNDVFIYDNTWTVVIKQAIIAINLISCYITSREVVCTFAHRMLSALLQCTFTDAHETMPYAKHCEYLTCMTGGQLNYLTSYQCIHLSHMYIPLYACSALGAVSTSEHPPRLIVYRLLGCLLEYIHAASGCESVCFTFMSSE